MKSLSVSRRDFLKASASIALASASLSNIGFTPARALPPPKNKVYEGKKIPSVCPYCAVGCTVVGTVIDGEVVDVGPDLEAPHTEGTLCPKGEASMQLLPQFNPYRLRRPLIRTNPKKGENEDPGWKEITWEEAYSVIVDKYKQIYNEWRGKKPYLDEKGNYLILGGRLYNAQGQGQMDLDPKALPIAQLSGDYMSNEIAYHNRKRAMLMGTNNTDIQARRCHSTTVAGLADLFGFGGMTNSAPDFANARAILQIGSNSAEQHPVAFRFISRAIENGATYIVFDPRFNRSASKAHIFSWFRPGSEAAIMLGLWNYIVKNNLYDKDYLEKRTDAFKKAPTGKTVFDELAERASRYTPEEVSRITGVPVDKFLKIAKAWTDPSKRPATIIWCIGCTQHTCGTSIIRALGITLMLLGMIGKPGGGGNVLRGITNVQGSNDMNHLQNIWLGYRRVPGASGEREVLAGGAVADIRRYQKYKNLINEGKSAAEIQEALGIAWVGDLRHWAAWRVAEKEWGIFIGTVPESDPDKGVVISDAPVLPGLTTIEYFRLMEKGKLKMLFVIGMNPVVSVGNANQVIRGLSAPGTFTVAMDLFLSETAHFADIVLPSASRYETSGSVTNTSRWIQWRHQLQNDDKVVDPFDAQRRTFKDIKDELWFSDQLFKRLRKEGLMTLPSEQFTKDNNVPLAELRKLSSGKNADELMNYGNPPDAFEVSKEINKTVRIYTGMVGPKGENVMASRDKSPVDDYDAKWHLFKKWAHSWPDNQRILYNLEETGGKVGPLGLTFFKPDSLATIWSSFYARRSQPIPVHFEPAETPTLALARDYPPLVIDHPYGVKGVSSHPMNSFANGLVIGTVEEGYDIILTTFRLVEHQHTGQLTRNVPWLAEMVPEHWIEISPSLAQKLVVKTGDRVRVQSKRGEFVTKALVTKRVAPLMIDGKLFEIAAAPWAWGFAGPVTGPITNKVMIDAGDDETGMPETKIALVKITKA